MSRQRTGGVVMTKYRVSYVIEAENIGEALTELVYPVDARGHGLDDGRDMSKVSLVDIEEYPYGE
jgi:ArsR family metal-binding transcriptional regulator